MTIRVAIVGGGLGGLAAAVFLERSHIDVTVHEQAFELSEVGAGIVVPPNMVRPLRRVGLADRLPDFAVRLEAAWEFRRWQDGRVLFVQSMGEECERLYGGYCYVAHRADLRAMFRQALADRVLRLDQRCVGVNQAKDEVELLFVNRSGQETRVIADAAIDADGIHSTIREAIVSPAAPRFSGLCAFRGLVPAGQRPGMALRPVQTLWIGPGRHFVQYPVRGGRLVNVVASAPAGDWRTESWTAEGQISDMTREFEGWDERLHQLITSATDTKRWALFDRAPLDRWTQGRIGLLGDAAHSMLPFFAQGAAQSIEDALALACCLQSADKGSVEAALRRYEEVRRPRANHVLVMSRGREVRNHLPDGPEQRQRDLELATGQPLRQNAWLYGSDWESELPL